MAEHNELGVKGEKIAQAYLKKEGYTVLAVNWRAHKFEIDIIAQRAKQIVFVEVKTRSTNQFGKPEESVDTYKERHLLNGAEYYLNKHDIDLEARFDIISIVMDNESHQLKHIESALG